MTFRSPSRFRGFTLIELMIAVAILGILSSVAVYVYGKYIKKARASEVPEVFGEFLIREEVFHAENGRYTGEASEATFFPATISSDRTSLVALAKPAYWDALRIKLSKQALYCQYVAVAGVVGDVPGIEGFKLWNNVPPVANWFYLRAQCDLDGNTTVNSHYLQRGDRSAVFKENEGR